jgi:hypothetical protein
MLGARRMGISLVSLINLVRPDPKWRFLIQHGADGYTTNVPRDDVERDDVFIAYEARWLYAVQLHNILSHCCPHLSSAMESRYPKCTGLLEL